MRINDRRRGSWGRDTEGGLSCGAFAVASTARSWLVCRTPSAAEPRRHRAGVAKPGEGEMEKLSVARLSMAAAVAALLTSCLAVSAAAQSSTRLAGVVAGRC